MKLSFQHAIRAMILGLGIIPLRVGAGVDAPKGSSSAYINKESGNAVDLSLLEWGLLVGIVLLALVVVARNIKRHD